MIGQRIWLFLGFLTYTNKFLSMSFKYTLTRSRLFKNKNKTNKNNPGPSFNKKRRSFVNLHFLSQEGWFTGSVCDFFELCLLLFKVKGVKSIDWTAARSKFEPLVV